MRKVVEFSPAPDSVIIPRVLVLVHKAIDENFPNAKPTSRKFSKTVFSDADEPTVNQLLPETGGVGNQESGLRPQRNLNRLKNYDPSSRNQDFNDDVDSIMGLNGSTKHQTIIGCITLLIGIIIAYLIFG